MRRIFLIDCPGVVYPTGETETEKILKGVVSCCRICCSFEFPNWWILVGFALTFLGSFVQVRVEYVKNPEDSIDAVLDRVKPEYVKKTYKIEKWNNAEDFLEQMARRSGRLLKVIALSTVGKCVQSRRRLLGQDPCSKKFGCRKGSRTFVLWPRWY